MPKAPPLPTSPSAPDVGQVRTWLEEMLRARRFLELIAAVLALITRLRDLNTELTKRLAELRRARPKSETLRRLERQLSLPFGNERNVETVSEMKVRFHCGTDVRENATRMRNNDEVHLCALDDFK